MLTDYPRPSGQQRLLRLLRCGDRFPRSCRRLCLFRLLLEPIRRIHIGPDAPNPRRLRPDGLPLGDPRGNVGFGHLVGIEVRRALQLIGIPLQRHPLFAMSRLTVAADLLAWEPGSASGYSSGTRNPQRYAVVLDLEVITCVVASCRVLPCPSHAYRA
jgi:hypothetical protein